MNKFTLITIRMSLAIMLITCCMNACFAASPNGDKAFWPQFHGPNRDNRSTETDLLKQWPKKGPKLSWETKGIGFGYSSVAIAGGRIFTAGNIKDKTVVTAMDMSGKILWQTENGQGWIDEEVYPGTRGTPTIDGDYVYHESPHGDVACFEVKTGKKLWGRNILKEYSSENIYWGLSESLLIDGDRLICCPGGPKSCMIAVDKKTGKTIWEAQSAEKDPAGYASPILVEHKGLRVIITLSLKAMIGVNADTGALLWRFPHESYADENVLTPIFKDGHIFISSIVAGSVKWKLNVDGDKASVTEVWRSEELDSHHDAVVLLDNHIYGCSRTMNPMKWICLDWKTGDKKYAKRGAGRGSVTYADGLLYTFSEKGIMGLVKATPEDFKVISEFKLPKKGEGPHWAHPVVCDGRLYLRHADFLYTYDIADEKK